MANLVVRSIDVLSENEESLPQQSPGIFLARFNPVSQPLRFSNKLYLALTCDVTNAPVQPIQGVFRIRMDTHNEYDFFEYGNPGDGDVRYFKQLRHGDTVLLPFRIKNLKPFSDITNAKLTIFAKDTAGPSAGPTPFQIRRRV